GGDVSVRGGKQVQECRRDSSIPFAEANKKESRRVLTLLHLPPLFGPRLASPVALAGLMEDRAAQPPARHALPSRKTPPYSSLNDFKGQKQFLSFCALPCPGTAQLTNIQESTRALTSAARKTNRGSQGEQAPPAKNFSQKTSYRAACQS